MSSYLRIDGSGNIIGIGSLTGSNNNVTIYIDANAERSLRQLRAPDSGFVGRSDELKQLLYQLSTAIQERQAAICVLCGPGGMGKTQLALALAQRLGERFTGGQLFLDLGGSKALPLTPKGAMDSVLRSLGVGPQELADSSLEQLRDLYCMRLNERPVLLLADDAQGASQVAELRPPPGSVLLVTSRMRFTLDSNCVESVAGLSRTDAAQLARSLCKPLSEYEERCIVDSCGGCPLAVRIVCARLAAAQSPAQRAEQLQLLSGGGMLGQDFSDADDRNLMRSLRWSYDLLPSSAQAVFCSLGALQSTFDKLAAIVVAGRAPEEVDEALEILQRFCLVHEAQQAPQQRYHLHDVIRSLAVTLGSAEQAKSDAAHHRMVEHFARILRYAEAMYANNVPYNGPTAEKPVDSRGVEQLPCTAPLAALILAESGLTVVIAQELIGRVDYIRKIGLSLFDTERSNILASQRWAAKRLHIDTQAAQSVLEYVSKVGFILWLRLSAEEQKQWHAAAVQAAQKIGDEYAHALALGRYALALLDQGSLAEAKKFLEQARRIFRSLNDHRHDDELDSIEGLLLKAQGQHRAAIACFSRSIASAERKKDDKLRGHELCNMGLAYVELNELDTAIDIFRCSVEASELAHNPHGQSNALSALGSAYRKKGDLEQAIDALRWSLKLRREISYEDGIRPLLGELGDVLSRRGRKDDLEEALTLFREQIHRLRGRTSQLAKGSHVAALGGISTCNILLRRFAEAVPVCKEGIAIAESLDRPPAPLLTILKANLGTAYIELGRLGTGERFANFLLAVEYYTEALSAAEEAEDVDSKTNIKMNLAVVMHLLADPANQKDSLNHFQQARALAEKNGNQEQLAEVLRNLGLYHLQTGDGRAALQVLRQSAELDGRLLAPQLIDTLLDIGVIHLDLGELQQALEQFESALAIARSRGKRRSEATAIGNIGVALMGLNRTDEAIRFLGQHLTLTQAIGDTAGQGRALSNLGKVAAARGEKEAAAKYLTAAISLLQVAGESYNEAMAGKELADLKIQSGQYPVAYAGLRAALTAAKRCTHWKRQAEALNELGIVASQLKSRAGLRLAFQCFRRGAALMHKVDDPIDEALGIHNCAETLFMLGRRRWSTAVAERAYRILSERGSPLLAELRRAQELWSS